MIRQRALGARKPLLAAAIDTKAPYQVFPLIKPQQLLESWVASLNAGATSR